VIQKLNVEHLNESIIISSQPALAAQLALINSPNSSFISSTQKPSEFDSSQSITFFRSCLWCFINNSLYLII
jgi:hypothetical protein